jgi:ribosomal protein L37AE/L43A|tara:strand:- start:571 stop:1119 length:549 start_codon:yes stop_codon:yes gene_type:complete
MARSREDVRQNKAMQQILRGETPDKRIFVAMEDINEQKERKKLSDEERKEAEKRTEALKAARMPWFCPKCDKVMKKNVDDKMWRLYGHCSDCQIQFENRLMIDGKYDDWVKSVERENKLAWIRDQRDTIYEFKKQNKVEFLQQVRPDGHSLDKERWEIDTKDIMKKAEEYLDYLQKMEDSLV